MLGGKIVNRIRKIYSISAIAYCFLTIILTLTLIYNNFRILEYMWVTTYMYVLYVLMAITLLLRNFFKKNRSLLKFATEWTFVTLSVFLSFIFQGIICSLFMLDNAYTVTPLLLSIILNSLLVVLLLKLLHIVDKWNLLCDFFSNNWVMLIKSLLVFIPFLMLNLFVIGRNLDLSFGYFSIYYICCAIYLIIEILWVIRSNYKDLFSLTVSLLTVINITIRVAFYRIFPPYNLYEIPYISDLVTGYIFFLVVSIIVIFIFYIFSNNRKIHHSKVFLINSVFYFITNIVLYISIVQLMGNVSFE